MLKQRRTHSNRLKRLKIMIRIRRYGFKNDENEFSSTGKSGGHSADYVLGQEIIIATNFTNITIREYSKKEKKGRSIQFLSDMDQKLFNLSECSKD